MTLNEQLSSEGSGLQRVRRFWDSNWKWLTSLALAIIFVPRMVHFGYVAEDRRETSLPVEKFHARANANQLDDIYDEADPLFQRSISKDAWVAFMHAKRDQYGRFGRVITAKFNVVQKAPVRIRAQYQSEFEKGPVTEVFAFIRDGSEIRLAAYGILPPQTTTTTPGTGSGP